MDITFLVGNGFDLSLGYKTSYKDFYEWYLDQPAAPAYKDAIARMKDDIAKDIRSGSENWSDFEIGLGKFTKNLKDNEIDDFVAAYGDSVSKLNSYLSSLSKKKKISLITEEQWDKIRKDICFFYQEGNDIEKAFFYNLKVNDQGGGWETTFHIVSFNYTNFLDECVKKISKKPLEVWKHGSVEKRHFMDQNVFHVHGSLSDFPIVGVSNKEQIANADFRKNNYFCASLIKSKSIEEIGSSRYSAMTNIINKSRIICLWGLSLGDSDKHWWKFICEWLKSNQEKSVFIFEHTDDPPDKILVPVTYQKKRLVINRLLRHSDFSEVDKENLLPRIHVIFNTQNVFSIGKIIGDSANV